LANAGDINGDGYDDIIVSGDEYSNDINREGIVYAFYGQPQQCDPPQHTSIYYMTPNSVTIGWDWLYGAQKYKFYMKRVDGPGTEYKITTQDSVLIIGGLVAGAHYVAYVAGKCDGGWTDRSTILDFYTPVHKEGELTNMEVFPSPTSNKINISIGNSTGPVAVRIFNLNGELMYSKIFQVDELQTVIVINEITNFAVGNYLVMVESSSNKITKQIVKQ